MTMTITDVNRRDFLLMRTGHQTDAVILSCEQLYMRYVDARASGTTASLFARLLEELHGVKRVRLIKTSWLADKELETQLETVFESFRRDGGRIEH
jgi:hypothetical protein